MWETRGGEGGGSPRGFGEQGNIGKYRREQGNISQFLGTGEQNSKNYSTKTFRKCVGTWEHRAILEGNKGTRTPLGDPQGGLSYKNDAGCSSSRLGVQITDFGLT